MDFDRRSLMLVAMSSMVSGCAKATPSKEHTVRKPGPSDWPAFKAAFVQPDGRIIDNGNGGISHSEGQGYALVLAEAAGDRQAFGRILGWTEKTLARKDLALFSWRYDPRQAVPVSDPNNATDGDILIAWALMRGGARWQDKTLLARAAQIREAIRANLLRQAFGRTLMLPGLAGFEAPGRVTVNLSYYIWPALDLFARADPATEWKALIADGEAMVKLARFGPLGLPADWTDVTGKTGFAPAMGHDPRFGFDAIRIPLYLMLGNRTALAGQIGHFWQSYVDRGLPVPAWADVVTGEIAPYALSRGGLAVVKRLLGKAGAAPPAPGADYYTRVLEALVQL